MVVQTYTVISPLYPDVNVAPYNFVPSIDAITEHSDFTVLFDNDAFHRVSKDDKKRHAFRDKELDENNMAEKKNYAQINSMMSQIMTSLSAPMRYYSPMYSRMMHIAGYLCPLPPMQFIQPAFTPFASTKVGPGTDLVVYPDARPVISHITDPNRLISSAACIVNKIAEERGRKELEQKERERKIRMSASMTEITSPVLQQTQPVRQRVPSGAAACATTAQFYDIEPPPKRKTTMQELLSEHSLLAGLAIIQTDASVPQLPLTDIIPKRHIGLKCAEYKSPPWNGASSNMQITRSHLSPYMNHDQQPVTGLLLANHTSVSIMFQRMLQKYVEQRNKRAFLNEYEKESVVDIMDIAREHLDGLISWYKEANSPEFMNMC